jgi:hypothetical protein
MTLAARSLLGLVTAAAVLVGLVGCGRTESYRYKLTLAVNTPEGIKRGSSVVEVTFRGVSIPARGTMHDLRGEALYLDLGPGARPLIVLLTRRLQPYLREERPWTPDGGPGIERMSRLYGVPLSANGMDTVAAIARARGPRPITRAELPDLVTFENVTDPKSVLSVNPNDLSAALGSAVSWNEITLESTDEPITTGLDKKLPWLPAHYRGMLDGERYSAGKTLANTLSAADFQQPGDPKQ